MDKKSLLVGVIMLILFIGIVVWRNINQDDLKEHGVLVSAKILRVNLGGKVSGGFHCLIKYNNEEIELPSSSSLKRNKFNFVGKTFPAMYLPSNETLEVLIAPVDFEKFNIPFPDSLNWVMQYVLEK